MKGRAKEKCWACQGAVGRSMYWNAKREVGGRLKSSQVAFCVLPSLDFSADIGKSFESLEFMSDMTIFAF